MSPRPRSDSSDSYQDIERLKKDLDGVAKSLRETDETVDILWKEYEKEPDPLEELRDEIHEINMKLIDLDLDDLRDELKEATKELETLIKEEGEGIREDLEELLSEQSEDGLSELTDLRARLEEEMEQIRDEINEDKEEAKKVLLEVLEAIEPLQNTLEDHQGRLDSIRSEDEFSASRRKVGTYLVVIGAIINVIFLLREWQFYSETDNELAGMLVFLGVGTSASAIGAAMMSKDF